MKFIFCCYLFIIAVTFGCTNHDLAVKPTNDYLVFGSFYGMCFGEGCVEIFLLQGNTLYEDINDQYPNSNKIYDGNYKALSNEKFELVKDLLNKVPEQLLHEQNTIIGCPDCADGGGIYIQVNSSEGKRFWLIDNSKNNIPAYLHHLVDEVNAKVNLLR